jgi:NAD-dependent dihydropyrimidine dehydrogenase PreA subunit
MGVFIEIEIDQHGAAPELHDAIARVCPVDIFAVREGRLVVDADEEDECTLCALCLKLAPPGMIRIRKLYCDETLVSTGEAHG